MTAAWSHVNAITPETEILWYYDPKIDKSIAVFRCCGSVIIQSALFISGVSIFTSLRLELK